MKPNLSQIGMGKEISVGSMGQTGGLGWGMCVGQRVLLVGLGFDAEHVPFMGYGMEIGLPSGAMWGGERVPFRG